MKDLTCSSKQKTIHAERGEMKIAYNHSLIAFLYCFDLTQIKTAIEKATIEVIKN